MKDRSSFWVVVGCIALAIVGLHSSCAHAEDRLPKWDLVSRFGFAYKDIPAFNSSYLMSADCVKAIVVEPVVYARSGGTHSCGGDNPAFVGYPIALRREWFRGALTGYFGPFHQSQWFDGHGEIQWTGPAVEVEVNWSQLRRNRRR